MKLTVGLIHNEKLPIHAYGGTERVVWWLAKGLAELGVQVKLACAPGSHCDFAEVITPNFDSDLEKALPGIDLFHYFNTPTTEPTKPYVVTIGGNGKVGEKFLRNTIFVSRNHAERHQAETFVYNMIDPSEYQFSADKKGYAVFLAKASWRVKNVKGAIRFCRRAHRELHIIGGSRPWLKSWRGVHWEGFLGGESKAKWLAEASGLVFPVLWHEPFGIAVIEALVSGTPVLATPFGSLPELVPQSVGRICHTQKEFVESLTRLDEFNPKICREWALDQFHYRRIAQQYLEQYEKVLQGHSLNSSIPEASEPPQKRLELPIG